MLCIYGIIRHPLLVFAEGEEAMGTLKDIMCHSLPVFAKGEEAMGTLKDIITACGYYITLSMFFQ